MDFQFGNPCFDVWKTAALKEGVVFIKKASQVFKICEAWMFMYILAYTA